MHTLSLHTNPLHFVNTLLHHILHYYAFSTNHLLALHTLTLTKHALQLQLALKYTLSLLELHLRPNHTFFSYLSFKTILLTSTYSLATNALSLHFLSTSVHLHFVHIMPQTWSPRSINPSISLHRTYTPPYMSPIVL